MQKIWSLYNKSEKLRIDALTADQVRTILLAISSSKMLDWYACREGDMQWQRIKDFPEFYEDVHAAKGDSFVPADDDTEPTKTKTKTDVKSKKPSGPPATAAQKSKRRPLFEDAPAGKTEATLQMEAVQTKERRSARRFPRRLVFRAASSSKTFESQTVDISMSGLSLKEKPPSWLNQTFRAELVFSGVKLKILCSKVEDNKLKIVEAEAWDILRLWIANW